MIEEQGYDKHIELEIEGELVLGIISELSKFYIKVEIVYPYCNWTNSSTINGKGRMTPQHFLTRYEEVSERLLANMYELIKTLDENIDRYTKAYTYLREELDFLVFIVDHKVRKRIDMKLRDWFISQIESNANDLVVSGYDMAIVFEVLEAYREDGRKLYTVDLMPYKNNKGKNEK